MRRACAAATGSPPAMRRFDTSMYQSAYSSHKKERTRSPACSACMHMSMCEHEHGMSMGMCMCMYRRKVGLGHLLLGHLLHARTHRPKVIVLELVGDVGGERVQARDDPALRQRQLRHLLRPHRARDRQCGALLARVRVRVRVKGEGEG